MFFYNKGIEGDFYVPDDGLAVQVSYSIDNPVTLEREVRAIRKPLSSFTGRGKEDFRGERQLPGRVCRPWPAWEMSGDFFLIFGKESMPSDWKIQ